MKVGIVGSGNWGTAIACHIAKSQALTENTNSAVILWVFDEIYQGMKISNEINEKHTNNKYLPGVALPQNVIARTTVDFTDADVMVFCLPHQFVETVKTLKVNPKASWINLSKGLFWDGSQLKAPSEYIGNLIGVECSCLMGGNIASEVAAGALSEATIGLANDSHRELFIKLFAHGRFGLEVVPYNRGIEICGAVKNVIAVVFGACEGAGLGKNTQAVIIRRGLQEIKIISNILYGDVNLLSSACLGDLIASCLGGRNYKFGVELGRSGISVEKYESGMNGQKLQGPGTAKVLMEWASRQGLRSGTLPITELAYRMCFEGAKPSEINNIKMCD